MFGDKYFKPWVGKYYPSSFPKVMVIGESRYDQEYTDYDIINEGVGGRSHTNFLQAAMGVRHWEKNYNPDLFWEKSIFYNYNTTFFPGKARVTLGWDEREKSSNKKFLKKMLVKYMPTHCIIWGKGNWESIEIDGVDWEPEKPIPNLPIQTYRSVKLNGNITIFTWVRHPSAAFAHDYWKEVISSFLKIDPN